MPPTPVRSGELAAVGAVEDRSVGESKQLVVPLHDLHPVGDLEAGGVGVERRNRRLCLILAELILREGGLQSPAQVGSSGRAR